MPPRAGGGGYEDQGPGGGGAADTRCRCSQQITLPSVHHCPGDDAFKQHTVSRSRTTSTLLLLYAGTTREALGVRGMASPMAEYVLPIVLAACHAWPASALLCGSGPCFNATLMFARHILT